MPLRRLLERANLSPNFNSATIVILRVAQNDVTDSVGRKYFYKYLSINTKYFQL